MWVRPTPHLGTFCALVATQNDTLMRRVGDCTEADYCSSLSLKRAEVKVRGLPWGVLQAQEWKAFVSAQSAQKYGVPPKASMK
eukprot:2543694-Amphidinium_carterae.1